MVNCKCMVNLFACVFWKGPESEKAVHYRVEMLVLFVFGPFVVLGLLSVLALLVCRRLHHGRLERLHEFDTEQGAIDGLIASNVGDSTLAVLYHYTLQLFLKYILYITDIRTCMEYVTFILFGEWIVMGNFTHESIDVHSFIQKFGIFFKCLSLLCSPRLYLFE